MKKNQAGFTLIELVVVIVILGILAVTAAPRFLNLQDDARHATLKGLTGAINSALPIAYSKAAINGQEHAASASIDNLTLSYGYPLATQESLGQAVDGLNGDWNYFPSPTTGENAALIIFSNNTSIQNYIPDETCAVVYRQAGENQAAKAYLIGSECDGLSFNEVP